MDLFDLFCKISIDDGDLNRGVINASEKMKALSSMFIQTGSTSDTLQDKIEDLSRQYDEAQKEVEELTSALNDSAKETGTESAETQELAKRLKEAESKANGLQEEIDELAASEDDAGKETSIFGDVLKANLASEAIIAGVKALGEAIKTVASKVAELTKVSIEGYADYEQLVGGVETLFGAGGQRLEEYAESVGKTVDEVSDEYNKLISAQEKVMDNAEEAYKTAGLSANDYMETITGFSASLLQGLGGDTEKAAEIADLAITDMADNANKMGTGIELIQNAYQGFAKQNYTMLDNLKLGYGGTQAEMIRLINDSGILNETIEDLDNVSFDQMIEAIHVVQTNMGITGTTAKEARKTIQGSVSSMKSAWANLTTGIADENANLDTLIDNFVESVGTAGRNILPRIEIALTGIGTMVTKMAPMITDAVPILITQVIPSLVSAGASMVLAIVSGIGGSLPTLLQESTDAAVSFIDGLSSGIAQGVPEFLAQALPMLVEFTGQIKENAGQLIDAGLNLILQLAQGIANSLPVLIENVPFIVSNIANIINENAPKILETGVQIIITLIVGIIRAIPTLIANIPKIVNAVVDVIQAFNWLNLGKTIITSLKNGITSMVSAVKSAGTSVKNGIVDVIKNLPSKLKELAIKAVSNIKNQFINTNWANVGKQVLTGLWNGISDKVSWLKSKVSGVVEKIKGWFTGKNGFDEHSPSKWAKQVFQYVMEGGEEGLEAGVPNLMRNVNSVIGQVKDNFDLASDEMLFPDVKALYADNYGNMADAVQQIEMSSVERYTGANSSFANNTAFEIMNNKLDSMIAVLEQYLPYLPDITNMQVVFDDGAAVGRMAPKMNVAMNRIRMQGARGV